MTYRIIIDADIICDTVIDIIIPEYFIAVVVITCFSLFMYLFYVL